MERTFRRAGADTLPGHLERRYGIVVAGTRVLDVGVFAVQRRDGRDWIARVFPADRALDAADGDAGVLRFLQDAGYGAERCARPDPVSVHHGQGVLVTERVTGSPLGSGEPGLRMLGERLGRLHALPLDDGSASHPGGAWHHVALGGGPREEIDAVRSLLDAAAGRVRSEERAMYAALAQELAGAEDCHGLPEALVHPDFVAANAIRTSDAEVVMVDWTGAGRGPRVWPLAFLLWAAGPSRAGAVIAGYGAHVHLEEPELQRLAAAAVTRPLVLACWGLCTGRERLADVSGRLASIRARAEAVAAIARAAAGAPAN